MTGSRVLLRVEDHDRERSRAIYERAMLEDLEWLGFVPDAGPVRQADTAALYEGALELLRAKAPVYACDCTRSTYAAWTAQHGTHWAGSGCPGDCRDRQLEPTDDMTLRVAFGPGIESWEDRLLGPRAGDPSASGDPPLRDRHGNWTYGFAVVVDDLRQSISLVVRGEDLADATPAQIRLGRLLGRLRAPEFAHHPLIRKPGGGKLSKSDGDHGVRDLRAAGWKPADVIGAAAAATGLIPFAHSLEPRRVQQLFEG